MKNKQLNFIKLYPGIFIILFIYIIALFIARPIANMPFVDSWAYARITNAFLDTGNIQFVGLGAMNLVFHILWGALFCIFSGFSFISLHISTLVLSILASIIFYLIIKHLGFEEPKATLASLILIANPIFFINSFTYMTDVPFMCWMLISIYFYLRSLNEKGCIFLFLGSLFSILAFLVRQFGILIPIATIIFYLINQEQRKRLNLYRFLILIVFPFVSTITFLYWHHFQPNVDRLHLSLRSPQEGMFILYYSGFFALPLILSFMPGLKDFYNKYKNNFLISFGIILVSMVSCKELMPYFDEINKYGVYPNEMLAGTRDIVISKTMWVWITIFTSFASVFILTLILSKLKDILIAVSHNSFVAKILRILFLSIGFLSLFFCSLLVLFKKQIFQLYRILYDYSYSHINDVLPKRSFELNFSKVIAINTNLISWLIIISITSFILFLILKLFSDSKRSKVELKDFNKIFSSPYILIYLIALLQFGSLIVMRALGDRYLIPLIPGIIIFILVCTKNIRFYKIVFIVTLCLFLGYSIVMTEDTARWGEARWKAADSLLKQGISSCDIDGGYEWNGWHYKMPILDIPYEFVTPKAFKPKQLYLKGMFSEIDNKYVVSYSPIEGYIVMQKIEYKSILFYLTNKKKYIYILSRL